MLKLNRVTAGLLLLLLLPVILPIRLYRWVTGAGKKPSYRSTIEGDPLAYSGDRPLVVALWATWATVWKVATEQIVLELQAEFEGRCEFAYVEANRAVEERYGVTVTPAVLVFHGGREIGRFINLAESAELRSRISAALAAATPGATQTGGR